LNEAIIEVSYNCLKGMGSVQNWSKGQNHMSEKLALKLLQRIWQWQNILRPKEFDVDILT